MDFKSYFNSDELKNIPPEMEEKPPVPEKPTEEEDDDLSILGLDSAMLVGTNIVKKVGNRNINVFLSMTQDEFIAVVYALRVAANFSRLMDAIARGQGNTPINLLDAGDINDLKKQIESLIETTNDDF